MEINIRTRMQLWVNSIPFLAFFLYFIIALFLKDGFAYDPDTLYYQEYYRY
jgi:cytochrome d ubiquinol oxidase subunit II